MSTGVLAKLEQQHQIIRMTSTVSRDIRLSRYIQKSEKHNPIDKELLSDDVPCYFEICNMEWRQPLDQQQRCSAISYDGIHAPHCHSNTMHKLEQSLRSHINATTPVVRAGDEIQNILRHILGLRIRQLSQLVIPRSEGLAF